MIDLYLRASDRAPMDAALLSAELIDGETMRAFGSSICISRIGSISRVTDYNGEVPIIDIDDRYHVNLRLLFEPTNEQMAALVGVIIMPPPERPYRVWASNTSL